MYTVSSRLGYRSTRHTPSSRLSFCAARLKRARCDSHGLLSLSTCGDVIIVLIAGFSGMNAGRDCRSLWMQGRMLAGAGQFPDAGGQTFRVYEGGWVGSKAGKVPV